ncbi:MAG: hypothetical protein SOZ34_11265 [Clostridia bacterium]|nr:hypothetical protein [Clostridia bacterium]
MDEKNFNGENEEMENMEAEEMEEVNESETYEDEVSDTDSFDEEVENSYTETDELSEDYNEAAENDDFTEDGNEENDYVTGEITDNYSYETEEETESKKKSYGAVIAIAVIVVALVAGAIWALNGNINKNKNPYNPMNYPVSEENTIGYLTENYGMELSEFLEMYKLPEDMPENTPLYCIDDYVPCETYAQMCGYENFDALKEVCQLPDETTVSEPKTLLEKIKSIFKKEEPQPITGDTRWGIALDEMTLGVYVNGEENLDEFKQQFGLGDEITADTKYKEVRPAIEEYIRVKMLEQIEEQEKAKEEAATDDSGENNTDSEETDGTVEQPVEESQTDEASQADAAE